MPEKELKKEDSGVNDFVSNIVGDIEKRYDEKKAQEIQELYNDIVDVITRRKAHLANILASLELVKINLVNQKLAQIQKSP